MNVYSEDLGKKIVEKLGSGMGKSEAAPIFSVKRYARMAEEDRSLAPKKRSGSKPKLSERASRVLEGDLKERSFIILQEEISLRAPFLLSSEPC